MVKLVLISAQFWCVCIGLMGKPLKKLICFREKKKKLDKKGYFKLA
jgi:hypothetical protein